MTIAIGGRLKA